MRLALVVILGVVVLGLAGTAIYRAVVKGRVPDEPPAPVAMVEFPVANRAILPGETIRSEDLRTESIPEPEVASRVPADAARKGDPVAGGTATTAIADGAFFVRGSFTPPPESLSHKVEPGYVALTIQVPPTPSLYDLKFLQPDDRVDVFGVKKGENETQTTTVLLAPNVRLLAVDDIYDKYKREQEVAAAKAEIARLQQEKANAQAGGLATTDQLTAFDEQIAAQQAIIDHVVENPSITVELTPEQSTYVALWRNEGDLEVALHRTEDAASILFADNAALATPSAMAAAATPGPTPVLTLEDVVPLRLRSVKDHAERLQTEEEILTMPSERQVNVLENDVAAERLRVELENLRRYGTSTPPVEIAAPTFPVVPTGGGADLGEVKELLGQMRQDINELRGGTTPAPHRHRVQVIRGTDVEVVES